MKLIPLFIITILLTSIFTGIPTTLAVPTEQIINGGFETAGATFWNYDNWGVDSRVNTDSHSGSWSFNGYSVHNNQTFGVPLQVSGISELSYWHKGDQVPIIKIIYSDTSEEDITDAKSIADWAQKDITADLDAGGLSEVVFLRCKFSLILIPLLLVSTYLRYFVAGNDYGWVWCFDRIMEFVVWLGFLELNSQELGILKIYL